MNQIEELTNKLQRELYSKSEPGEIILNLREMWLERFLAKYKCNLEALMLGFMFSDFKLQEAIDLRKPQEHIRMASEYAMQSFERYDQIPDDIRLITLDIVKSHHGGETNCIESRLFKNAEAMSYLEPKGWIHFFGSYYDDRGESAFEFSLKKVTEKIESSFLSVDLDEETIAEAKNLKEYYDWFKTRVL